MKELEDYINDFCNKAILKGDFATPAKYDHKLHKDLCVSYQNIISYGDKGIKAFEVLLSHENLYVQLWTATQLLILGNKNAITNLKSISQRNDILGFNAKMTLKEYENGSLKSPFD